MPREAVISLTGREAVARALEHLTEAWRAGHVAAFSLVAEINGISRISVVYVAGAPGLDVGDEPG